MEPYIRNTINYNKWTVKKLLKHETWPAEQQGHIVVPPPIEGTWEGRTIWKWDEVDILAESYAFFGLWRGQSPFFHILTADASWPGGNHDVTRWLGTYITASIASQARMRVNNAPKQGRRALLRQVWDGKSSRGIPSSALLKDAIWADGDDHYPLYCWTTMKRKLDHVARRIEAAPRFAVNEERKKKFAALLVAKDLGWEKLSKWQMVEISLMAADVDRVLTQHGVTEEVANPTPIDPSGHTIIQITHSLGHQHVPSLTARQAQRSAVSQEVLRRLWA